MSTKKNPNKGNKNNVKPEIRAKVTGISVPAVKNRTIDEATEVAMSILSPLVSDVLLDVMVRKGFTPPVATAGFVKATAHIAGAMLEGMDRLCECRRCKDKKPARKGK